MKFPRMTSLAAVSAGLVLTLTACGGSSSGGTSSTTGAAPSAATSAAPADLSGTTVVIYTPNEQNMLDVLIPAFEKESGAKVNLITAATGELYTRIKNEAAKPQGDVLFGGGAAQAMINSTMWEPYTSVNDADMVDLGKGIGGYATPYQADGSNLLVNTDKVGDIPIASYADLLNPALKGKIAFGDPTESSSAFAQLTNMLKAVGGDYESDAGWSYVKKLVANLNGVAIGSSNQVAQDVVNGEYVVALTYEPLSNNLVQTGAPVKIVYPKEGAAFLPATTQIIKGAPHVAGAKAFLDFITSEMAQQLLASQTSGRPLREGITKEGIPALADIKTIKEDSVYVAGHRDEIVAKYQAILEGNG